VGEGQRPPPVGGDRGRRLGRPGQVVGHHRRPGPGAGQPLLAPDPLPGPGDDHHLAVQRAHAPSHPVVLGVPSSSIMKVAVLSDTHAPRYWKACPAEVARRLDGADLILHAGDVCRASVLEELAGFAPVRAVLGNNDTPDVAAWGAPATLELDLDGLAVAMVHDAGPAQGRPARLRRRFPGAELVVFGHSHIPLDEEGDGGRIFNPGPPPDPRRPPRGPRG